MRRGPLERVAFWTCLAIIVAFGLLLGQDAANAYPAGPEGWHTQESCERFGCLYSNTRCEQQIRRSDTDGKPDCRTDYGISHDLLPDGPDGRKFLAVFWPMVNSSYRATPARLADWSRIIECESRWDWRAENPRSSASGAFQILQASTWRAYGGLEFAVDPSDAHPIEQLAVAERILWAGYGQHGPQGNAWACPGEPGRPS